MPLSSLSKPDFGSLIVVIKFGCNAMGAVRGRIIASENSLPLE
jgi:hypothetical protein